MSANRVNVLLRHLQPATTDVVAASPVAAKKAPLKV
jgi:hypothetical protein